MSAHLAMCAGFHAGKGAVADVVLYDLARVKVLPMEVAHDFSGGGWCRVQRTEGYHSVMVNGESTFEDGRCSATQLCCAALSKSAPVGYGVRMMVFMIPL
jgi:N-acyl-D-amino-acid deacylase